jgi:hypothetical protein
MKLTSRAADLRITLRALMGTIGFLALYLAVVATIVKSGQASPPLNLAMVGVVSAYFLGAFLHLCRPI